MKLLLDSEKANDYAASESTPARVQLTIEEEMIMNSERRSQDCIHELETSTLAWDDSAQRRRYQQFTILYYCRFELRCLRSTMLRIWEEPR